MLIQKWSAIVTYVTEDHLLLEQHAERHALSFLRGANFTHCLHLNGIAPDMSISTRTGTIVVRGSDLYNKSTWMKFVRVHAQDMDLCLLVGVVDVLATRYREWLLTAYTSRYRQITTESELAWFNHVVMLVVARRIMENKYEASLRDQQSHFADAWVAGEMGVIMALHDATKAFAQAVHHVVREYLEKGHQNAQLSEHAQTLLELVYEKHATFLLQRATVPHHPLPPLPPGMVSPLRALSEGKAESHE